MKVSKKEILIILYLFSVLVLFLAYNMVAKPKLSETETVLAENNSLQTQVEELNEKEAQVENLEKEIESMSVEAESLTAQYPSSISEEDVVLYVNEVNEALDMQVTGVSFSAATPVYSVVGAGSLEGNNYTLQQIQVNVDYTTDYDGFKRIVNYINADKDHREITSVSISVSESEPESGEQFDENGEEAKEQVLSGSFALMLYYVDGALDDGSRYPEAEVEHGRENVFEEPSREAQ